MECKFFVPIVTTKCGKGIFFVSIAFISLIAKHINLKKYMHLISDLPDQDKLLFCVILAAV